MLTCIQVALYFFCEEKDFKTFKSRVLYAQTENPKFIAENECELLIVKEFGSLGLPKNFGGVCVGWLKEIRNRFVSKPKFRIVNHRQNGAIHIQCPKIMNDS